MNILNLSQALLPFILKGESGGLYFNTILYNYYDSKCWLFSSLLTFGPSLPQPQGKQKNSLQENF